MDNLNDLLFFVGVPILFGVNAVGLAPFASLCSRIAEIEGRQAEFRSLKSDDGGWNSFRQEQYMKLWRRDYRRFGDTTLNALGDRAFRWAAVAGAVSVVAVAMFVVRLSTHGA